MMTGPLTTDEVAELKQLREQIAAWRRGSRQDLGFDNVIRCRELHVRELRGLGVPEWQLSLMFPGHNPEQGFTRT